MLNKNIVCNHRIKDTEITKFFCGLSFRLWLWRKGDWKVSALTAVMKAMGKNGNGTSDFMEDYTYHLVDGNEYSLSVHMLEVCPSLAADKPRIEVYPLSIGDRKPPARLVFEGKQGKAIVATMVDIGGRFRLIVQDIDCVKPIMPMPNGVLFSPYLTSYSELFI